MISRESQACSSFRTEGVSRRVLMLGATSAALLGGFPSTAWAAPETGSLAADKEKARAAQQAARALRPGEVSENGWPIETRTNAGGGVWTRPVPGTSLSIDLSSSVAGSLLLYVIARVHKEVLELSQEDLVGFPDVTLKSHVRPRSNHRSGTAVNLSFSAGRRPRGSFFAPADASLIEEIVSSTQGVVAWGGSSRVRETQRNETYFDIAVGPDTSAALDVAKTLTPWGVLK